MAGRARSATVGGATKLDLLTASNRVPSLESDKPRTLSFGNGHKEAPKPPLKAGLLPRKLITASLTASNAISVSMPVLMPARPTSVNMYSNIEEMTVAYEETLNGHQADVDADPLKYMIVFPVDDVLVRCSCTHCNFFYKLV